MANTTVVPGFAWSYSQLKNGETCPKRYYHYNVAKDVQEPETEQLREGNALHKAFELRIAKGQALPAVYASFEPLLNRIATAEGKVFAEQKLALTSEFKPTTFFGRGAWFRGVSDATVVNGHQGSVFDWKTGKPSEDLTQLQLLAATVFAHHPAVQRVKAALVFVNHDHVEPATFTRESLTEIWAEILPRVKWLEKMRATNDYPPKPSGLCRKYCAVSSCPHHGR